MWPTRFTGFLPILFALVLISLVSCAGQDHPKATMPLPCQISMGADGHPRVYCSSAAVQIPRPW